MYTHIPKSNANSLYSPTRLGKLLDRYKQADMEIRATKVTGKQFAQADKIGDDQVFPSQRLIVAVVFGVVVFISYFSFFYTSASSISHTLMPRFMLHRLTSVGRAQLLQLCREKIADDSEDQRRAYALNDLKTALLGEWPSCA